MSKHLTPIQAELLDLARRPQGIDETEAGQLIETVEPLEREMPVRQDDGTITQEHKPGVWGTDARGRARLRTLADAGWLTYDAEDEVYRVGGGSPRRQRHRRPRRAALRVRPRPSRVTA